MDLLNGDMMMSTLSFDETWTKVIDAVRASSTEQFRWELHEDRSGNRITADMEYKQDMRLRRRLLLEINFFRSEDDRVRLDLHYQINPMFNVGRPTEILASAVDAIADAVSAKQEIHSLTNVPPQLAAVAQPDKKDRNILAAVEVLIIANLIIMAVGAFPGGADYSHALFQLETWIVALSAVGAGMRGIMNNSRASAGAGIFAGVLGTVACAFFLIFVVLPILAIGLCVGSLSQIHYNN
jgi:hypothetical protein